MCVFEICFFEKPTIWGHQSTATCHVVMETERAFSVLTRVVSNNFLSNNKWVHDLIHGLGKADELLFVYLPLGSCSPPGSGDQRLTVYLLYSSIHRYTGMVMLGSH